MNITPVTITKMADIYKLLGDPTRLSILLYCINHPKTVSDIVARLGISQSLVSHHIRHLKTAKLLTGKRENKFIYYRAADEHVSHMLADLKEHILEEK